MKTKKTFPIKLRLWGTVLFYLLVFFSNLEAKDWYVRPKQPSVYGAGNGSSYADAWNSLFNVVWGAGGVQPGDNLYICGLHYIKINSHVFPGAAGTSFYFGASGTPGNPITVRMDYPADTGVVWDAVLYTLQYPWNGPDANGVYWTINKARPINAELYQGNIKFLTVVNSTTWANGQGFGTMHKRGDTVYVKTSDGSHPQNKILNIGDGYKFELKTHSHITFSNCSFNGTKILANKAGVNSSKYITIDSCSIKRAPIDIFEGYDYWTVKNSDLGPYTGQGIIYTHTPGNMYNFVVSNNSIHDNIIPPGSTMDHHGIGIQNCMSCIIEYNHVWNTGEAIGFWSSSFDMKDNIVRYNFVEDVHVVPGNTGGVGINIANGNVPPGKRTGNKIYGNIVKNTGVGATLNWQGQGIKASCTDYVEIYNNILIDVNCQQGALTVDASTNYPLKASVHNNIVINPLNSVGEFVAVWGDPDSTWQLSMDNNLYFPNANAGTKFYHSKYGFKSFTGWKNSGLDSNGMATDPMFLSAKPVTLSDFALQAGSPAIDAGKIVGMLSDIIGTTVPLDGDNNASFIPDIGALEHIFISTVPPTSLFTTSTNSACEGSCISYTDQSTNSPTQWSWVFPGGNPSSSNLQNPGTVCYAAAGNYTASLTVTNTNGSSTSTKSITVNSLPSPFISGSSSVCSGSSITLIAGGGIGYSWNTGATTGNITASPANTTTYSVTVTNANGCTNATSRVVSVNPLPIVSLSTNSLVCAGSPAFTLSGSPAGGIYNGIGVSGNSFDPSVAGTGTHTITYNYTDGNNCSNSVTANITVSACTGIGNTSIRGGVNIYPNPATGELHILFTGNTTESIIIRDIIGKTIETIAVQGETSVVVNTEKYPAGIYSYSLVNKEALTYFGKFSVIK